MSLTGHPGAPPTRVGVLDRRHHRRLVHRRRDQRGAGAPRAHGRGHEGRRRHARLSGRDRRERDRPALRGRDAGPDRRAPSERGAVRRLPDPGSLHHHRRRRRRRVSPARARRSSGADLAADPASRPTSLRVANHAGVEGRAERGRSPRVPPPNGSRSCAPPVCPAGPSTRSPTWSNDPQVAARNMIVEVDDPRAGTVKVSGCPIKMSAFADPHVRATAPALDGDRARILAELDDTRRGTCRRAPERRSRASPSGGTRVTSAETPHADVRCRRKPARRAAARPTTQARWARHCRMRWRARQDPRHRRRCRAEGISPSDLIFCCAFRGRPRRFGSPRNGEPRGPRSSWHSYWTGVARGGSEMRPVIDGVMRRLAQATAESQRALRQHPLQRDLALGVLPRMTYVAWIGQLFFVHRALEWHLGRLRAHVPPLARWSTTTTSTRPALASDLSCFGVDLQQRRAPGVDARRDRADRRRRRACAARPPRLRLRAGREEERRPRRSPSARGSPIAWDRGRASPTSIRTARRSASAGSTSASTWRRPASSPPRSPSSPTPPGCMHQSLIAIMDEHPRQRSRQASEPLCERGRSSRAPPKRSVEPHRGVDATGTSRRRRGRRGACGRRRPRTPGR